MLRWGIIGLGNIANTFANDLNLIEGHSLQAVASRSATKACNFADTHGAHNAYGSYRELLDDAQVDIVYIATPHNSHMQLGVDAMSNGKHVLCEKPLGVSHRQVQDLIAASTMYDRFLMEALWTRFNPAFVDVLRVIKEGVIGDVTFINADFCFHREVDLQKRLFNPDLAGGALLDVGIYPLFLSYMILGYPDEMKASSIKHANGIDLQTSMILDYKSAHASLNCGLISNSEMIAKINGTKGSIHIDERWHEAQGYTLIKDNEKTHYDIPKIGKGYGHEIMECDECISNGQIESSKWSHDDSLQLISMMDTLRQSNGIIYPFE